MDNDQYQPMKKDNQKLLVSSSPETPISGDGKLLIKLKIPKAEEGEEGGKVQTRVCEVCKKEFSSGKALGGHMRVHFQPKEVSLRKLKTTKCKKQRQQAIDSSRNRDHCNDATNASGGGDSKPTCPLCSKNFPSMKSLFGHMRCHPDREWRGIQPPPVAKNYLSDKKTDGQIDSEATTMAMENPVTDLTQSLRGWSATGRRSGGKALASTSEEERLRDAVQDLMRLANGNSLESGLTQMHMAEECEATNSNSLTNKAEIDDKNRVSESKRKRIDSSPVGYRSDYPVKKLKIEERGSSDGGNSDVKLKNMDGGKDKCVLETGYFPDQKSMSMQWIDTDWHGGDDDDESDGKNTIEQLMNTTRPMTIKNKKRRKKLKLMDLESVRDGNPVDHQIPIQKSIVIAKTTPPHRYKCSTCNRYFTTHQALGGHRSSHNKGMNLHTTIGESSSAAAEDEHQANPIAQVHETKESEGAASSKLVESTHECKICHKIFPTGQALGGHKRCHWTSAVEGPSSQAASPGEASHTGPKVLGFDLNQLPAVEDEEGIEHEAAGYGYPSSSYNSAA